MAVHVLDLTHTLEPGMFTWPGDPEFTLTPVGESEAFRANRITVSDHGGTHMGTAAHFDRNGLDVAGLGPEQLIQPAVCLDFSRACREQPDYLVRIEDIRQWEAEREQIPPDRVVLVATGQDRFWAEPRRYFGEPDAPCFPGITPEAVRWLVEKRHVTGIGIDTAGIDGSAGTDLAANRILLRKNRFHLENLTRLTPLPATGFTLYIGVLPVRGAGGSPCRVWATWDDGK